MQAYYGYFFAFVIYLLGICNMHTIGSMIEHHHGIRMNPAFRYVIYLLWPVFVLASLALIKTTDESAD